MQFGIRRLAVPRPLILIPANFRPLKVRPLAVTPIGQPAGG